MMAIKALGIAVKLTVNGNNQFNRVSTFVFAGVVVGSIAVQMHYLNLAMHCFSVSLFVLPLSFSLYFHNQLTDFLIS